MKRPQCRVENPDGFKLCTVKDNLVQPFPILNRTTTFGMNILFRHKIAAVLGVTIIALTLNAFAGDFDGSKQLSGTTRKIIEIKQHKIVDNVDPDTIGLPKNFQIDFDAKVLRPSKDSLVRKVISFKSVEHIENKIVMQGIDEGVEGIEDGLAWSLAISQKNGEAVLAASGDGVAYVVFGVCIPIRQDQ